MFSFDEFKRIFDVIQGEPEFEFFFQNTKRTYMIIKYDNHISFQRCSDIDNKSSGEYDYQSLQMLYDEEELIDGICLKNMWTDITSIIANGTYDLFIELEAADFIKRCGE